MRARGTFFCPSFDSTVISAVCAFGGKVLEDVEGRRMEGCTEAEAEAGAVGGEVQTEVGTAGRVWLLQLRWRRVK